MRDVPMDWDDTQLAARRRLRVNRCCRASSPASGMVHLRILIILFAAPTVLRRRMLGLIDARVRPSAMRIDDRAADALFSDRRGKRDPFVEGRDGCVEVVASGTARARRARQTDARRSAGGSAKIGQPPRGVDRWKTEDIAKARTASARVH
jgi:hypothetical protein